MTNGDRRTGSARSTRHQAPRRLVETRRSATHHPPASRWLCPIGTNTTCGHAGSDRRSGSAPGSLPPHREAQQADRLSPGGRPVWPIGTNTPNRRGPATADTSSFGTSVVPNRDAPLAGRPPTGGTPDVANWHQQICGHGRQRAQKWLGARLAAASSRCAPRRSAVHGDHAGCGRSATTRIADMAETTPDLNQTNIPPPHRRAPPTGRPWAGGAETATGWHQRGLATCAAAAAGGGPAAGVARPVSLRPRCGALGRLTSAPDCR
jgi:hypothetical protein